MTILQMKKNVIIYCYLVVLVIFSTSLYGAFELLSTGASPRATGMGDAYCGISDDSNGIFYNPAGLTQVKSKQFYLVYSQFAIATEDSPINNGRFSICIPFGEKIGTLSLGFTTLSWEKIYYENAYLLGYSRKIRDKINIGGVAKILSLGYSGEEISENIYFSERNAITSFSLDCGLLLVPTSQLSLGLGLRNLIEPNIGIQEENKLPTGVYLGIAYRIERLPSFVGLVDVDILISKYTRDINIGFETQHISRKMSFNLRGGINFWSTAVNINLGFGIAFSKFKVDLAYSLPLELRENNSYKLGFGINF